MNKKKTGQRRGPVRPNTSSSVKTTAGRVLATGHASDSEARTLAASVMRHEPARKVRKKP